MVEEHGRPPREMPISGDPFRIGRDPQGEVVLRDIGVSRHHASIRREEKGYLLEDLGSRNGTFLNENKLPPRRACPLRDGDRIAVGRCLLRVLLRISSERSESAPEPRLTTEALKPNLEFDSDISAPTPLLEPLCLFRLRKLEAFLIVREGNRAGIRRLPSDRVRIGRSASSDIALNDPSVSEEHAEIVFNREGFFLVDRNSGGGTFLDGLAITVSRLEHRGYLRFGKQKALFVVHEEGKEFPEASFAFRDHLIDLYPERERECAKAFQECREEGLDIAEELVVRGVLDPEEWWVAAQEFRRRHHSGPRGVLDRLLGIRRR